MDGKIMKALAEATIERVKGMSEEELQAVIDRPFKPSCGNSEFDLEKWAAKITLASQAKGMGD